MTTRLRSGSGSRSRAVLVPFSMVDELSCYFDVPAEPNNVHLEVRIPGQLDYPVLHDAVTAALAKQSRASGRRATWRKLQPRFFWEHPPALDLDPVSRITWADEAELNRSRQEFMSSAPPLDCAPPVRVLVAAGPSAVHVILNVHHAAMDGISCLELLSEISRRYAAAARDNLPPSPHWPSAGSAVADPSPPPEPGPASPMTGGPAHAGHHGLPRRPAHAGLRSLPRRPARIAASPGSRLDGYGLLLLPMPVPSVPALTAGRATLNDLLVAAMVVAVGRWNSAQGKPARQVKITVPVNARQPGQQRAAGNMSRLTTVGAWPPAEGTDLRIVLAQVAAQTRRARAATGPQLGAGPRWLARTLCPVAIKAWLVRAALRAIGPAVCDTAVLTNLGNIQDPPQFGQPGPVSMAFSTSAHMPRGLSVGAITAAGQLQLGLRYRKALLDGVAAQRFAAHLSSAIAELADLASR
jgi:NRPS condensation-like uncharacterized protein